MCRLRFTLWMIIPINDPDGHRMPQNDAISQRAMALQKTGKNLRFLVHCDTRVNRGINLGWAAILSITRPSWMIRFNRGQANQKRDRVLKSNSKSMNPAFRFRQRRRVLIALRGKRFYARTIDVISHISNELW
jgi:hypothetical protein